MAEAGDTRQRILRAAYACVARHGITATTVEEVAAEASLSRATIYRHFPSGRPELIAATVTWEVGRFFEALRADVGDPPDFATLLERSLRAAHRRLEQHEVLHTVLRAEADELLPPLATVMPIVLGMLRDDYARRLTSERLRPGVDPGEAADLLARLTLSFMGTPGTWDLDDPEEVRELVRSQLLAGVLMST